MKNKILFAFALAVCFGLTIAVYAVRFNSSTANAAQISATVADGKKDSCGMADCCTDGHCKMNGSCCKSADSCPLKAKQKTENQSADADYSKITFTETDGKDCCAAGASCCHGDACCKGKHS